MSCSKLIPIQFKSCKKSNNSIKGHEPKLYEALGVIAGLFSDFAYVKMKGPNKNNLTVNNLPALSLKPCSSERSFVKIEKFCIQRKHF